MPEDLPQLTDLPEGGIKVNYDERRNRVRIAFTTEARLPTANPALIVETEQRFTWAFKLELDEARGLMLDLENAVKEYATRNS